MRHGISVTVTAADRRRLEAIIRNRNAPQKHVWRAEIVLLTPDGHGTMEHAPHGKVQVQRVTHDYKRHGTTTLFAALNVLDGTVIGRNMQRHRHQEFIRFLNAIEAEVPAGKLVHVILDNCAAHKHPKVIAWARPPPVLHLPLHPKSRAPVVAFVDRQSPLSMPLGSPSIRGGGDATRTTDDRSNWRPACGILRYSPLAG
jgi:hypothetical protein